MNKLYLLIDYLKQNKEFETLTVHQNSITYQGRTINFDGFDIEKFLYGSENLLNNIENLPMSDIFNIIKLHVDYMNMIKRFEEEEAKKMMNNFVSNNPSLSKFHIFKNIDSMGYNKSFLKYTDNNGNNYVLQDVSEKELLMTYMEIRNSGLEVTEEQLFRNLVSKYKQVKMENILEAEKRIGVSEEHLNNMKSIINKNNEHMENHNVVLGNEEYGIYLNNDNVITMGYNKSGNKVVEKHANSNGNENEEELSNDVISNYDEQQLISFEEYSSIIANSESLNDDEKVKIDNFENFLFDVMTYKDYLTPELYQVYDKFYKFWDYLSAVKETTMVIEDSITRYQGMHDRSEQRQAVNAKNKVTVLQRRYDNTSNYGYVNALLYVGIVVFVGIVIAVITVLAK